MFKTYSQAAAFVYDRASASPTLKFGYEYLERAKMLLNFLGNPQDKLKIVHVVGTSGKGSTAYLTSVLLKSAGLKVGLFVKPHILDIRERIQVQNELIPQEDFLRLVNLLNPAYEKMGLTKIGYPSYLELTLAIAYMYFVEQRVDYAVIETGMGGRYDATNVGAREDKIVLYTKIGFDHTKFLGHTLSKIADEKARVIKRNNVVFAIWQNPTVRRIVEMVAKEQSAPLHFIQEGTHFKNSTVSEYGTLFDFTFKNVELKAIELGLYGSHQVENASLALAGAYYLSKRDAFVLAEKNIRNALRTAVFAGRLEKIKIGNKTIIIDGAHNPQKIRALVKSVKIIFKKEKPTFLVAFKDGKDVTQMLKIIIPFAKEIIVTDFFTDKQDWVVKSISPEKVGKKLKSVEFPNYTVISNSHKALQRLLSASNNAVITGSLYLIGEIYAQLKQKAVR